MSASVVCFQTQAAKKTSSQWGRVTRHFLWQSDRSGIKWLYINNEAFHHFIFTWKVYMCKLVFCQEWNNAPVYNVEGLSFDHRTCVNVYRCSSVTQGKELRVSAARSQLTCRQPWSQLRGFTRCNSRCQTAESEGVWSRISTKHFQHSTFVTGQWLNCT